MIRDMLAMTALIVSVTGIGVSLAREEVRCYLGLSSTACESLENKSASPFHLQQTTNKPPENKPSDTPTTEPILPENENSPSQTSSARESLPTLNPVDAAEIPSTEGELSISQPMPTEPLSETIESENSPVSYPEETVSIPIKVEPYQEPSPSN